MRARAGLRTREDDMRIRSWNAFASNNSGSYVIVGNFPTAALARDVAAELREVAIAHSAWLKARAESTSPLATYAATLGLGYEPSSDDWPEYSDEPPAAWSVGHQLFVYADYTVTMPRVIGYAMYARGGRVETEIDHAHHPIVAMFEVYFPWQAPDRPTRVQALVDALCAEDGPLVAHAEQAPAWQAREAFGEPDLVIGTVFEDLATGFAVIAGAVASAGATLHVRLTEAMNERDALAMLRPCTPLPTRAK
jgi:hypothetical protein